MPTHPRTRLRGPWLRALAAIALLAGPAWTGRRIVHEQNRYAAAHSVSGAALDSVLRSADAAVDSIGREQRWYGYFLAHDPLAVARTLRTPHGIAPRGQRGPGASTDSQGRSWPAPSRHSPV